MNILVPSSRYPPPASPRTGVARVVMPPTFDPVPGSVTAIDAIFSPATSAGRYRARCSFVPNFAMCGVDM